MLVFEPQMVKICEIGLFWGKFLWKCKKRVTQLLLYVPILIKDIVERGNSILYTWIITNYSWKDLRSDDTLYRWHLLGIGQTKIIYYNLPDVTGNIDKKLNFIEYVPILIIPAYYK